LDRIFIPVGLFIAPFVLPVLGICFLAYKFMRRKESV
jgi:hypothetical protein